MKVLVTGVAGFIGFSVAKKLLNDNISVIGLDNLNDYYDIELKKSRLRVLETTYDSELFTFSKVDISNKEILTDLFEKYKPTHIIHLAAQAGVRYSLTHPHEYIKSNIEGFLNILENAKIFNIQHLIYASSSSVYGGNSELPFKEEVGVDHPISLYATSKRANELMAHTYSHLYDIPTTGLRFFTVYGPWGRPDMALFLFTEAILKGEAINVFNNGNMTRDFTYIDDLTDSIIKLIVIPPKGQPNLRNSELLNPSNSWAPYRILNIGNSSPIPLMRYIEILERELGIISKKNFLPMQAGDVQATYASTEELNSLIHSKPTTSPEIGIAYFIKWYKQYYKIDQ